ncbi:protein FAM180A-like [Acipenser oxyrinchus oxyrinchus]|uniref:Protein FAM180A-like n=1 Tax=Acipenser oxyrinchus oxyrinchus TaxID=40147 RepID=A0AAD8DES6_ACIOX|nr:protein FAM180A-like [Acipenser oxyrinchus oxyrinchus]
MMHWEVFVVALVYHNVYTSAIPGKNKALFPSAMLVKRGTAAMLNPVFQNSLEEVNLLYEILLAGLEMNKTHSKFFVKDEELSSLRKTKKLEVICEDVLPKKITDIRRLTFNLSRHKGLLSKDEFERTVLTMVYTAYRLAQATGHQKDAWAESFVNIYKALKDDLL